MRKTKEILIVALGISLLGGILGGCRKETVPPAEDDIRKVQALLNVGTSVNVGQPAAEEGELASLRVYAFVGGRPAGHYYMGGNLTTPSVFLMDLTMYSTTTTQTVDFYVIANESAMGGLTYNGAAYSLDETTTEEALKNIRFTSLSDAVLNGSAGLPMSCYERVEVDLTKTETPTAGVDMTGHEGHIIVQKIKFYLKRPVAKLGVFAAGVEGQTRDIIITSVQLHNEAESGYLMPRENPAVSLSTTYRSLFEGSMTLTKRLSPDAAQTVLEDESKYDEIVSSYYLFENPAGSSMWNVPVTQGSRLTFTYHPDGDTGTDQIGTVYLPAIERNKYYKVCCLINDRSLVIPSYEVIVGPWTSVELTVPPFN